MRLQPVNKKVNMIPKIFIVRSFHISETMKGIELEATMFLGNAIVTMILKIPFVDLRFKGSYWWTSPLKSMLLEACS